MEVPEQQAGVRHHWSATSPLPLKCSPILDLRSCFPTSGLLSQLERHGHAGRRVNGGIAFPQSPTTEPSANYGEHPSVQRVWWRVWTSFDQFDHFILYSTRGSFHSMCNCSPLNASRRQHNDPDSPHQLESDVQCDIHALVSLTDNHLLDSDILRRFYCVIAFTPALHGGV